MLKLARTILLSACLVAPALSLAQDRARIAEELLRKSGAWEQLGDVAAQVRAGLEQGLSTNTPRLSAPEELGIAKAADSSFASARLRATAARVVADGLADEDIAELRRWYESPTGVAITKREEQVSTNNVDSRKIATEGAAVLQRSSVQRRELLDTLVRETKAAQSGVDLLLSMNAATQRGVTGVAPGSPGVSNAQRQELLEAFGKVVTASAAFIYEPMTDADLRAYVNFLKSPVGQRFNALGTRALDTAMSEATEDFAGKVRVIKDAAPPKSALTPGQGDLVNEVREALSNRNCTGAPEKYRSLAEQGNVYAQALLGRCYEGVKDYAEAVKWHRLAANQEFAFSQTSLGLMYLGAPGVSRDSSEAAKWFRKAADSGDAYGQAYLGALYESGLGVPKDYTEAMKWYRKAADQGNIRSQLGVGTLYLQGLGVQKDEAEAAAWLCKAADQGSANAMTFLGDLYWHGKGVERDFVQAYVWLALAASSASAQDGLRTSAAKGRDKLSVLMSPAQIAEAQKRVEEWKPKRPSERLP